SMVVIRLPAAAAIGVTHERAGLPSRWIVQAPHSARPQPNLVPVMPSTSRSTQRTGVSSSTSTLRGTPLTLILTAIVTSSVSAYSMIGIVYDLRMSSARDDVTIVILLFASEVAPRRSAAASIATCLAPFPHSGYVAFSKWRPS